MLLSVVATVACHRTGEGKRVAAPLVDAAAAEDPKGDGPIIHSSGGISIWWTNSLRTARGGASVFAAIVGLSDVERLNIGDDTVRASRLPRPSFSSGVCTHAVPTVLVSADVDQDGSADVVVHDLCGSYVVWNAETMQPTATEEYPSSSGNNLPGDGPFEWIEVSSDSRGRQELAIGSRHGFALIRSADPGKGWVNVGDFAVPRVVQNSAKPRRGIVGLPSRSWLVVGDTDLYRLVWFGAEIVITTHPQSAPQPPFLVSFDSFDDLAAIGLGACGTSFVGIGQMSWTNRRYPGTLVQLDLPDVDGPMTLKSIAPNLDAFGVASLLAPDGSFYIGVIGANEGNGLFTVYRARPCQPLERLGQSSAVLERRRPPAPSQRERLPLIRGDVSITAQYVNGVPAFVTYDGYTAHVYRLREVGREWKISRQSSTLHEERNDIAFP